MNAIEISNVSFTYKNSERLVLKNLSLTMSQAATAFIGQNGAGKSTLMKLLKGLLKPDSGDILINGKNTKDTTAAKLAQDIGLIFQNPNDQIFKNRVIDEVAFGPSNFMSESEAHANTKRALETVGLLEKKDENPYDLSLADRKLITIASVLAMDTAIVIFDEPTLGQDTNGIQRIKEIIKQLKAEGKLVLAILHDMNFAAEIFERIVVMANGEIIGDGKPAEVFSDEEILKKAHVEAPFLMQLARLCGYSEKPLTREAFMRIYRKQKNVSTGT
ncbi:MAG TPA: ABC transporter ATP-binding protein [Bacillales bacterium]|nr:ABC transporter ATP-binding protein [Bacillales bacterium]